MKRPITFAMLLIVVGSLAAVPVQTMSAQSDGDTICDLAIAQEGTGQGQFGGYELVYAPNHGGSGSQVVVGTTGGDVLEGGSGNDVLCGLGGDDFLNGGSGNDILVGGGGTDQMYGQSGGDTIHGGPADTVLDGGTGRNQILVAESPGPIIIFEVFIGPLDENGRCDLTISFSVSNAVPGSRYRMFYDLFRDGTTNQFDQPDMAGPSGSASFFGESVDVLVAGNTTTNARLTDGDGISVLATSPDDVCA